MVKGEDEKKIRAYFITATTAGKMDSAGADLNPVASHTALPVDNQPLTDSAHFL
jgi:hypothetical protein